MRRAVSADSRSTREPGLCRRVVAAPGTAGNPDPGRLSGFKGRRSVTVARCVVTSLVTFLAAGSFAAAAASADTLYIDEGTENSVESVNATGSPLGALIPASPAGATGPRGTLRLRNGNFLVTYQNPGLPVNGDADEFATTGGFLRALARSWSKITQGPTNQHPRSPLVGAPAAKPSARPRIHYRGGGRKHSANADDQGAAALTPPRVAISTSAVLAGMPGNWRN